MSARSPGGWPNPPIFTDHALEQMAAKKILREAVELVCMTCQDPNHDEDNDSYELAGEVEGGRLEVAVTAESFHSDRLVIKTAYWLGSPRRRR